MRDQGAPPSAERFLVADQFDPAFVAWSACRRAPDGSTRSSSTVTASSFTSPMRRSRYSRAAATTGRTASARSPMRPGTSRLAARSSTERSSRPPRTAPWIFGTAERVEGPVEEDRHGRLRPARPHGPIVVHRRQNNGIGARRIRPPQLAACCGDSSSPAFSRSATARLPPAESPRILIHSM
jgi:hypothetical protein